MTKSKKRRKAAPDVPTYLRHKSGGRDRAFCYVSEEGERRRVYLGAWGSPESKCKFRSVIGSYLSEDRPRNERVRTDVEDGVTIEELVARFLFWGESHYVKHGERTKSWAGMKEAAAPLLDLFRDQLVCGFGPKKLQTVQSEMVDRGLARQTVNSRIRKLRRIFRWGVAEELVSPWVWEGLRAVSPLQRGRTKAKEAEPVGLVPLEVFRAVLGHLTASLRAMVQIQLLTGMRPGEVVQLRVADVDQNGPEGCWVFTPRSHKNEHRGQSRRVVLGSEVQRLMAPYMSGDLGRAMFRPAMAVEERKHVLREKRKSKVTPSQLARDARRRDRPGRVYRDEWTVVSYRQAVHSACKAAGVERWSPGQLRHSFQALAERACGLEAASKAMGHAQLGTTEHYRDRMSLDQAVRAMKAVERRVEVLIG